MAHREHGNSAAIRPRVRDSIFHLTESSFQRKYLPLLWHISQPLYAGGFIGRIGLTGSDIDPTCHGLMDDSLFLFLQQRDLLPLGANVAPDASVGVVEEANDGSLFWEGGNWQPHRFNASVGKPISRYTLRLYIELISQTFALQSAKQIATRKLINTWTQQGQVIS